VCRTVAIADDPLAAATIAGRAGVSARRLRRLPLMRDATRLAHDLVGIVATGRSAGHWVGIESEDASP